MRNWSRWAICGLPHRSNHHGSSRDPDFIARPRVHPYGSHLGCMTAKRNRRGANIATYQTPLVIVDKLQRLNTQ
jgi:hypothetical protein